MSLARTIFVGDFHPFNAKPQMTIKLAIEVNQGRTVQMSIASYLDGSREAWSLPPSDGARSI
jgi:hypothetical protein